jgi:hypothetical protein
MSQITDIIDDLVRIMSLSEKSLENEIRFARILDFICKLKKSKDPNET